MFEKRPDIPAIEAETMVESVILAFTNKTNGSGWTSFTCKVPKPLYEEIKAYQRKHGVDSIMEVIVKCLQSEAK